MPEKQSSIKYLQKYTKTVFINVKKFTILTHIQCDTWNYTFFKTISCTNMFE